MNKTTHKRYQILDITEWISLIFITDFFMHFVSTRSQNICWYTSHCMCTAKYVIGRNYTCSACFYWIQFFTFYFPEPILDYTRKAMIYIILGLTQYDTGTNSIYSWKKKKILGRRHITLNNQVSRISKLNIHYI